MQPSAVGQHKLCFLSIRQTSIRLTYLWSIESFRSVLCLPGKRKKEDFALSKNFVLVENSIIIIIIVKNFSLSIYYMLKFTAG